MPRTSAKTNAKVAIFKHLCDIVGMDVLMYDLIDDMGAQAVRKCLDNCKSVPTLEMIFEDELSLHQYDNNKPYYDPVTVPSGKLGDKLTHTKDVIQMRIFVKNLIKMRGIHEVQIQINGRTKLLQEILQLEINSTILEQRCFHQIPVNRNGKRVLAVPTTIVDIVKQETSGRSKSTRFRKMLPKRMKTIEFIDLDEIKD